MLQFAHSSPSESSAKQQIQMAPIALAVGDAAFLNLDSRPKEKWLLPGTASKVQNSRDRVQRHPFP